ncbi:ShlB/FhaC/HecB family hemolysin secretion/activation protein [Falsiroseomonas sp.]|uniref:ShlB/FhaC/HecB family hemolysin secretion/activation protein n=1 Tax=Falsiroseomonas sp. TaxID=2870721 RepID=UPI002733A911|nr:ShlB/FhaC/HecB family hemolysin secretion/activation protein [Falsiroseomonas sp.]MDP3418224.1 ShlB/FhaC/HecB family hemolysin secretion/activation protein [Falsiroseomonas sp.]
MTGTARRARFLVLPCCALLTGLTLAAGAALAQAPPAPPQGSPIPRLAPPATPPVGPGLGTAPAAPAAAPAGTLAISTVTLQGATALPPARLAPLTEGLTGPAVPLAAVEAARAAIVSLYREEGYVFTAVDAVLDAQGNLRLVVAEGHVTEVLLEGDIGPAGTQVLRFLNRLILRPALDVASLERALLLAQDIPGVAIRSVLRPAGTAPGALTLVAQVSRRPVTGYVTADNRAYRLTGPEQGLAAVQFNSFTEFGERTELILFGAAGETQIFGQASTEFFLGGSGLRARAYAGQGRATPSGALRGIGYEGETTTAGLALSYPLIRRRSESLLLTGQFDLIESEIEIDGANGRTTRLSRDSLRVLRIGAEWARFDLWLGEAFPAANSATLRASRGLEALGAERNGNADAARLGAQVDFTKLAFEVSRRQALFQPWAGADVALVGTLAGQWSDDILPLSEKFYLGGARLGRGFYAGEVTGDRALAASAELQLTTSFETEAWGTPLRLLPTFYAFYDHGKTWENQDQDPDRRLRSTGLGVRMPVNEVVELQLEGVRRLTRRPNPGAAEVKADALFWRVLARF